MLRAAECCAFSSVGRRWHTVGAMSEEGNNESDARVLGAPLELPCGLVLKNRLVKAAMSDSLGDGAGNPTEEQIELYRRWSAGGSALSLIGEMQVDHRYPEKPGNLVLGPGADMALLARLAGVGSADNAQVWPQLGHAGALAHLPISRPAGPSALDIAGLQCDALQQSDVEALPAVYASAAAQAQAAGFSGAEIHAGHGFLLSQFLSPLFNHRSDPSHLRRDDRGSMPTAPRHRAASPSGGGPAVRDRCESQLQ